MAMVHKKTECVVHLAVLAVLALVHVGEVESILGGSAGNICDFPGLAVVTGKNNEILCTGVLVGQQLTLPYKCQYILPGANMAAAIQVKSGGFKWSYAIGKAPAGSSTLDGTYLSTLNNIDRTTDADQVTCPAPVKQASLYDGIETLDFTTCQLAGYGADTNAGAVYTSSGLRVAKMSKSLSAPCCEKVMDTVTATEKGVGTLSDGYPTNCIKVEGSPCGLADLGDPIMCTTVESKKRVTIGLVASSPCVANGLFLAHDLTQSSPKTKYGVKAI